MKKLFKKQEQQRRAASKSLPRRDVFSYHHAGQNLSDRKDSGSGTLRMPQFRLPKSRLTIHHVPTVIVGVLVVVCVGYVSSLSTVPRVMLLTNDASRVLLRPKQEYETGIQQILQNDLANYTKLTVNTPRVQNDIKEKFPEVADIEVTLPIMGRRPVLELVVAIPRINLVSQSKTYIIDERGFVLSERDAITSVPKLYDEVNIDVEVGKQAMSREDVAFITTVNDQLVAKKYVIESMTLTRQAGELVVRLKGKNYTIKMNLYTDANVAIGAFLATIKKLESERQLPKEYIDVRVEERVFVK